jgi:hypothetical protein
MAPVTVDPQEFGEVKQMVKEMHAVIIHERCPLGIKNKINMRWMWSAVCGLAMAFGAGFVFLFKRG